MKKWFIALSMIFLISGCASKYKKMGFGGGYSETRLDNNVFTVTFRGNGHTSRERVSDFNLLRSAELSLQNGFKYFIIINSEKHNNHITYTTPINSTIHYSGFTYGNRYNATAYATTTGGKTYNITRPSSINTIVCFKEKPNFNGVIYNAKYISQSIKNKYDIK